MVYGLDLADHVKRYRIQVDSGAKVGVLLGKCTYDLLIAHGATPLRDFLWN
jgi:hypothetical protein